ncbi:TPA: phage tail protein [Klebsiella oxytoca]|nr:phage tail protein [Klebsiella oxytoca]
MSRSQLDDLTAFLNERMPPRAFQAFAAEADSGRMVRTTKDLGNGRFRICAVRYSVTLSWIDFPFRQYPPALVYAHVAAWIEERQTIPAGMSLEQSEPQIDPTLNHERAGDLYITMEVIDEVVIIQDPRGEIELMGQLWTLEDPRIDTAEEFDLSVTVAGGA